MKVEALSLICLVATSFAHGIGSKEPNKLMTLCPFTRSLRASGVAPSLRTTSAWVSIITRSSKKTGVP